MWLKPTQPDHRATRSTTVPNQLGFLKGCPRGSYPLPSLASVLVSSNASGALVKQCVSVLYVCYLSYLFL